MGSCSNRALNKSERLAKYAQNIASTRDTNSFEWETTKGAWIRGDLGVDKGNEFINAIRKASK